MGLQRPKTAVDFLRYLQLILNDEEVKIKTAMWMRQNADFLKEMRGICVVAEFNMISVWHPAMSCQRHSVFRLSIHLCVLCDRILKVCEL